MIRNYLLIAYRNLIKNLSLSAINIIGLSLGISCSLIIFLFVYGEWSYDRHVKDHERVYRVSTSWFNIGHFANGQEQLNGLLSNYAEVESTTRINWLRDVSMSTDGANIVKEPVVYAVDSSFFKIFTYSFVAGDPSTCLNRNENIVLTERMAKKYFGSADVIGRTLEVGDNKEPHVITGIVKDPDFKSHLRSEIWMRFKPTNATGWAQASVYNYIKLKPAYTDADLKRSLDNIIKTEAYPQFANGMSYEDWIKNPNAVKLFSTPLTDIYLKSKLKFELSPGGSEANLYIFMAVALLIIVLAIVNFVNLSTARSARRAKEVGLRKAFGTSRKSLVLQFLAESTVTSMAAMVLALLLAELFLSVYRQITGQVLISSIFLNWNYLLLAVVLSITAGIVAGIYPAFYLTRFLPVKVLKGNFQTIEGKAGFRNVLVVFQFTMSITLILSVIVVLQQLRYMNTKDLGFDKDNVFTIENISVLQKNAEAFRQQLDGFSQVNSTSFAAPSPASSGIMMSSYRTKDMEGRVTIHTMMVDDKFINTLGFRLVQGRGFDPRLDTDSTAAILNETAVKELMLDNPIDAEINKGMKVVGVVSDFHFQSVGEKIAPVVINFNPAGAWSLSCKLNGDANTFIKRVQEEWAKFSPNEPLKYSFMDQSFERLLEKEKVFAKVITFFTVLAIFISCLGLYGLSLFTAEQRTKEIGIRKICGASVQSIVIQLNTNFTKLVLVSVCIAVPVSIYMIRQWLSGFAYKIELQAWIYICGSLLALVLAWITVGYNSFSAASANPARTLKNE